MGKTSEGEGEALLEASKARLAALLERVRAKTQARDAGGKCLFRIVTVLV